MSEPRFPFPRLRFPFRDEIRLCVEALPIGLHRDLLYLWASFRMRNRPLKMLALIILLGGLCWVWEWAGLQYGAPQIQKWIGQINRRWMHVILLRTSNAIFSSLNFLSCASIVIISRSLMRLNREGHIESLLLAPRRIRPSALFYATGMRYALFSLAAMVAFYLEPQGSPFTRFPFQTIGRISPQAESMLADPWILRWEGLFHLSLAYYCPTNVFCDLALSFWIFMRWRLTIVSTIAAVLVIGLGSPVLLMGFSAWIHDNYQFWDIWQHLRPYTPSLAQHNVPGVIHYFVSGTFSLLLGLLALRNLDARWLRAVRSESVDPVLIRGDAMSH